MELVQSNNDIIVSSSSYENLDPEQLYEKVKDQILKMK